MVPGGVSVTFDGGGGVTLGRVVVAGELVFAGSRSAGLVLDQNLVVTGRLVMRPASPAVHHVIRFVGIDESRFRGGGMEVLDSDVGLWVMGDGVLDVSGSPKSAWVPAAGSIERGATSIGLSSVPVGWQPGDELVVTPTGDNSSYDQVSVASVAGPVVALNTPVANNGHPVVNGRWSAEVMDLSRNVEIGGTATGRSHVFIHSTQPQTISYATLSYMGPRRVSAHPVEGHPDAFVAGRYALHFHRMGDASRGSMIQGTVVVHSGSHAFVAHHSNGVTYRSTITHDTQEDPYWNDMFNNTAASDGTVTQDDSQTNDTLIDGAIASSAQLGFRQSGFMLGAGTGNRIRNSVAVGLQGWGADASGFGWQEDNKGNWLFDDNTAHNNTAHGIFNWQNEPLEHFPIRRFVAYYNTGDGIKHGAYLNRFRYEDNYLYANHATGLELLATSSPQTDERTGQALANDHPLSFVRMTIDQAGLATPAVRTNDHRLNSNGYPGVIRDSTLKGSTGPQVVAYTEEFNNPDYYDFINNTYQGTPFTWAQDHVMPGNTWRIQDPTNGTIALHPSYEPGGVYNPTWNTTITPIAPFAQPDFTSPFSDQLSPGPVPTPGP
jgi:hypothetical protein